MQDIGGTRRENTETGTAKPTGLRFSPELIRTVAIILIILVHASWFPYTIKDQATPTEQFNWWTVDVYAAVGYLGVSLFVILSGVLLLDPAKADQSLTVFFKKRFARIGLPMLFWTIAYFGWAHYIHKTPLTFDTVFSGLLSGSYVHLWFLYLLVGLYCVTPVLRIIVRHLNRQKFLFFLAIWFIGTVLQPFMSIFLPNVGFNPVMFVFTGWAGTFILGVFLMKNPNRSWMLYVGLIAGLLVAIIGDALVPFVAGDKGNGFFHEYLSFNMVIAAAALFLLLTSVPASKLQNGNSTVNRFINWVGKNSLGIYLMHIIVLETLEAGYLGFAINMSVLSPIIEVPLLTVVTLAITSLIVYCLKKIPYIGQIVG